MIFSKMLGNACTPGAAGKVVGSGLGDKMRNSVAKERERQLKPPWRTGAWAHFLYLSS